VIDELDQIQISHGRLCILVYLYKSHIRRLIVLIKGREVGKYISWVHGRACREQAKVWYIL
jgi:hypothetical protein